MLQVTELTKYFGGLAAVSDLSFEVEEGGIIGLVGPNGAGKTTVFNLITGFLQPNAGKVMFEGCDITGKKPHKIAALGLVRTFQSNLLFDDQSCLDNVITAHHMQRKANYFAMLFNTKSSRSEDTQIQSHAEEILERTGLIQIKTQLARSIPQGLKRALEIALALATHPSLLLMDEPTAGMSHNETQIVKNMIKQLNSQGLTIMLVEHNMRLVMEVCERVIVLNFGKKLAEGTPQEIINNRDVIDAYTRGKVSA